MCGSEVTDWTQNMPETETDEEEWQTYEDLGNGVQVKVKPDNNPVVCAVFDGSEKVTEETAALQLEQQLWAAEGYKKGKEKYGIPVEDLMY